MHPNDRATRYRADVDGLRAVAVLSVIVFHIDRHLLPGGFIGVDIFFVISGFLITRNILQELQAGHFSLLEFYRRRVKRIAPAMFVVVAATLVVAQFILLPEPASRVARSAAWSLASLANVYFWRHLDTSYFAQSTAEVPLLHLWSLGVEEQFYLLWPLILMLVFRARHFVTGAIVAALCSVLLAQSLFEHSPMFVYYMLPTRAGELLAGAIVASLVIRGRDERISNAAMTAMGLLGATLIAGSLIFIGEDRVFPGLLAIPPVLGATFVILSGQRGGLVARLLALKPMVWIGLVSYSAYLWHWPLLAFYRYGHSSVSPVAGLACLALTFVLAWLSYRFIEQPARKSRGSWQQVFVRQYAVPGALIGALAVAAIALDGYGPRYFYFSGYRQHLANIRTDRFPASRYDYVCQRQRLKSADVRNPRCIVGADSSDEPIAVLWGDSTAAHYVGMVGAFARSGGYRIRNVEHSACPPIDGDPGPFVDARFDSDCRASLAVARPLIEHFNVIIISSTWSSYRDNERFMRRFFDTVQRLAASGKQVILIGKAPEIPGYDPLCREKALAYPFMTCANVSAAPAAAVVRVNSQLRDFAAHTPNVTFYGVTDYLCPGGQCSSLTPSGEPIYYDTMHLTLRASWALGERILREKGLPKAFALNNGTPPVARVSSAAH